MESLQVAVEKSKQKWIGQSDVLLSWFFCPHPLFLECLGLLQRTVWPNTSCQHQTMHLEAGHMASAQREGQSPSCHPQPGWRVSFHGDPGACSWTLEKSTCCLWHCECNWWLCWCPPGQSSECWLLLLSELHSILISRQIHLSNRSHFVVDPGKHGTLVFRTFT